MKVPGLPSGRYGMACEDADRLSQISTMWTALVGVHGGSLDASRAGFAALIERYQKAVFRYLTAATGDPDQGAELFQEFALRFLRGDFRHAAPDRGRFRDYLRAALINLVRGRHRGGQRFPAAALDPDQIPADPTDPGHPADEAFLAHWRESLLDCAWQGLRDEEQGGGPPYHTALRARADLPDATAVDLARLLTERIRPADPYTEAGVRKLLQRGREMFTDRLVAEVARSVPTADRERLAEELIALGFHGYCKKALERWRVTG